HGPSRPIRPNFGRSHSVEREGRRISRHLDATSSSTLRESSGQDCPGGRMSKVHGTSHRSHTPHELPACEPDGEVPQEARDDSAPELPPTELSRKASAYDLTNEGGAVLDKPV